MFGYRNLGFGGYQVKHAPAGEVDSYNESNRNSDYSVYDGANVQVGQALTLSLHTHISSCKWYLKKSGTPTGNCYSKVYASTGTVGTSAVPTGSILGTSAAVDVSTFDGTWTLYEFTFTPVVEVNAGDICILFEYTGGDGTHQPNLGVDNTTPTHGGNLFKTTTAGSGWTAASGEDLIFYLYAA